MEHPPAALQPYSRFVLPIAFGFVQMALSSCSSSETNRAEAPIAEPSTYEHSTDGGSFGARDSGGGSQCATTSLRATTIKRPIDIVVIVDTSGTMSSALSSVRRNINVNFAQILLASGTDFRVILLADVDRMCISPPLGGDACGKPTSQFFPVNLATGSSNGLSLPIASYEKWSPHLRADAFKVILQISDTGSESDMSSFTFDDALLSAKPPQFGTAAARNYVYHGILGLPLKSPLTMPWLSTDPVLYGKCNRGDLYGWAQPAYQELAIRTGGLRYPVCEPDHYDVVFQEIAAGVISRSEIPCSLAKPTPTGAPLDDSTVVVRYAGTSGTTAFKQVADAARCTPGAFYVTSTAIELCPETCATVRADDSAKLDIEYGCPPPLR